MLNWSINYTKQDNKSYLLDKDAFTFITKDNEGKPAEKGSLPDFINNEYENVLGTNPSDYLDGNKIVKFAETLIQKYACEFSTIPQK